MQAARLARATPSQLAHWRKNGLVAPTGEQPFPYTFADLVALRIVTDWLRSGLTSAQVRRAVEFIRTAGEDLTTLRVVSDGTTVWACFEDGQVLDALRSGQLAFVIAVDGIAQEVDAEVRAFQAEREAFVAGLFGELDLVAAEAAEAAEAQSAAADVSV